MNDTIKSYQKQKFQKYKSKAWKSMAKYHDRTQTAQKLISEALRDKKKRLSDLPLDAVGLINFRTDKRVEFVKSK